jgi:hypothetical protein
MSAILPPDTDNHPGADVVLRASQRLQRPVARRTPAIKTRAKRGEHLHHVTDEIVVDLTVVEDDQSPLVR